MNTFIRFLCVYGVCQASVTAQAGGEERGFTLLTQRLADARVGHKLVSVDTDRVAVIGGGYGDWGGVGSIEILNLRDLSFKTFSGRLKEPRANATVTSLGSGRYFVAGGDTDFSPALSTTEIIDVNLGTVESGPDLLEARAGHIALPTADGRVVIAGGADFSRAISSAEVYDPQSQRIEPLQTSLSATREAPTVTALGQDRFLIAGGYGVQSGGQDSASEILQSAEIFDARLMVFIPITSHMTDRRLYHAASSLGDGRVLLTGGIRKLRESSASAEVFDPDTLTFAPVPAMRLPRASHSSVSLDDGSVVVCGGVLNGSGTAACERFEAQSGVFRFLSDMRLSRWSHQTVPLPGARFLVVGGMHLGTVADGEPAGPNRSAEIYQ